MDKFSTEDNEGNKDFNPSFSSLPSVKKVVAYVRGSTDDQGNTLEAQENQIRAYCACKHLELMRVFIDKGESGSTRFYERPAACEMLAWIGEVVRDQVGRRHSVRAARL